MARALRGYAGGKARRRSRREWSLFVGMIGGVGVRLHATLLALGALLLAGWTMAGLQTHCVELVFVLTACAVGHQAGLIVAALRTGIAPAEVILYPVGVCARWNDASAQPDEAWVPLAGAAVNALLAGGVYAAWSLSHRPALWGFARLGTGGFWPEVVGANLLIAYLGLLPALPAGGSRLLHSALAMRLGTRQATDLTVRVAQVSAGAFAVWAALAGQRELCIVAVLVSICVAEEGASHRSHVLLRDAPVADAMLTEFHVLEPGQTLRDAAMLILTTPQEDFPVVCGSRIVGVLSRRGLLEGVGSEGAGSYVAGSMDRAYISVAPHTSLLSVRPLMRARGRSCVMVVQDDEVRGIVTPEAIREYGAVRDALASAEPREA